MSGLIDLTGNRFGQWTVIAWASKDTYGHNFWHCRCDCGTERAVAGYRLKSGVSKSCGCVPHNANAHIVHGASKTRLYRIWCGMKQRCCDVNHKSYGQYGGRGIAICTEWLHDFGAFQEWAYSHGYREYLSIDRVDNDKGYCPDNCRWVTYSIQNANRRPYRKTALDAANIQDGKQTQQDD